MESIARDDFRRHVLHPLGLPERAGQMAAVDAINDRCRAAGVVALEAPCGTGKSLLMGAAARLVRPNGRLIVASYTNTEATQLVTTARALRSVGALGPVVELRGRSHYLCLDRAAGSPIRRELAPHTAALRALPNGYRHEVAAAIGRALTDHEWVGVASHTDECSSACDYDYLNKARVAALAPGATVITNHTIIAVNSKTGGRLLKLSGNDAVVIDEGHAFAGVLRSTFEATVTVAALTRLRHRVTDNSSVQMFDTAERAVERYFVAHAPDDAFRGGKYRKETIPAGGIPSDDLSSAVDDLCDTLDQLHAELGVNTWDEQIESRETRSVAAMIARIDRVNTPDSGWASWLRLPGGDRGRVEIGSVPRAVSRHVDTLRERVAAVVVMSATLGGAVCNELGVEPEHRVTVESPFNLATQRVGYTHECDPGADFASMVTAIRGTVKNAHPGGVLIAAKGTPVTRGPWTGRTQIDAIAEALRGDGWRVGVQHNTGDIPALVDGLRDATYDVIVGKTAIGQGVDIPGDRLTCVIVAGSPWPNMTDPHLVARGHHDNVWNIARPLRDTKLAQIVGRAIRSDTDHAAVVFAGKPGDVAAFATAMRPSIIRPLPAYTGRHRP